MTPAWASGIQPAGSKARTIRAINATCRAKRKIPCMAWVFAPLRAVVKPPGVAGSDRERPVFRTAARRDHQRRVPRSDGYAAIHDEILSGGELGIIAGQPQHNAGNFLGLAQAAHGLAGGEGLARGFVVAAFPQPLLQ